MVIGTSAILDVARIIADDSCTRKWTQTLRFETTLPLKIRSDERTLWYNHAGVSSTSWSPQADKADATSHYYRFDPNFATYFLRSISVCKSRLVSWTTEDPCLTRTLWISTRTRPHAVAQRAVTVLGCVCDAEDPFFIDSA